MQYIWWLKKPRNNWVKVQVQESPKLSDLKNKILTQFIYLFKLSDPLLHKPLLYGTVKLT